METHFSRFLELEGSLWISQDLTTDRIVFWVGSFYVNVAFAQPLYQYVALVVHLYLDSLINVTFRFLGFGVAHRIVEATKAYSVIFDIETLKFHIQSCLDFDWLRKTKGSEQSSRILCFFFFLWKK